MKLSLENVDFSGDFASVSIDGVSEIIMYSLDESIENRETFKNIICLKQTRNSDVQELISSLIGFKYGSIYLDTDYEEYKGQVLNKDNYRYCYFEVEE